MSSTGKIFEFGGGREAVVTAEKAEALLSAIVVKDPSHIKLSNKSFSSEAALCISKHLLKFKNIEIADISDIIAGRAEEDALLTLKTICDSILGDKLIELNVSDNALGSKGVTACKSLFTRKSLKRLYACNNGLSADACVLVSELLLESGCPELTTLHFYNNMSGDGGAAAIAGIVQACPLLEDFRFSATRSSGVGCSAVANALTTLTALRRLDLQDNTFSDKAGALLASSIKSQSSLVYLNLRDAGLKEKGTSAVMKALMEGKQCLEFLDMSGNDVAAAQAEELKDLLQCSHMQSLKELHLDDNEIESEGAVFLAEGVKGLKSLECLSVCTCEITAYGAFVLARAVADLPQYVTMKADGNRIFPYGLERISSLLLSAGKLLEEMEDNDEDGEEDMFEDALQAAEKEDKKRSLAAKEEAAAASLAKLIGAPLSALPVTAPASPAKPSAATATAAGAAGVDVKAETPLSLKSVDDKDETDTAEDDLVDAMQSTTISGSSISDMPTP